jgi:nitroreductase
MPATAPLTDTQLLEQLHWRYATKKFDATRKIPQEHWQTLEQALVLSASSYGLQPYRFLVIRDPALRARLSPAANKQPQILDASHLVVFCAFTDITVAHVDHFIALTAQASGAPAEKLAPYRQHIMGDLVNGPRHAIIQDWCKRQTYLALGNLLASAAVLGIDACPMEGFSPADFDAILGLPAQQLAATVLCTLGYRSAEDHRANAPKMRFPASELIVYR